MKLIVYLVGLVTLLALLVSAGATFAIYRATSAYVTYAERQWEVMVDSNKAVLAAENTVPDLDQGVVHIQIDNIGRTPSPYVHLITYEVRLHPPEDSVIECQRSDYPPVQHTDGAKYSRSGHSNAQLDAIGQVETHDVGEQWPCCRNGHICRNP